MSAWEILGKSDEWYTPAYILEAMGDPLFTVDVAAPVEGPRHVRAKTWFHERSLDLLWTGFIWMNPPFGGRNGLEPWLRKFIAHGNGIALAPDRTSAPWFQEAAPRMTSALFLSPKVKFERPDGSLGESPGSGTVLFGIGERADECLERASWLGWLGWLIQQRNHK